MCAKGPPRQALRAVLWRRTIIAASASTAGLALSVWVLQESAPAAAADAAGSSADPPAANFGGAVPSDRFVHDFQRQVVQQLQTTLNQASREQDERLKRFEQQAQQLREQSDAIKRDLDQMQSRASDSAEPGSDPAPRINVRLAHEVPPPGDLATGHTRIPDAATIATGTQGSSTTASRPVRNRPTEANLSPHGFAEGTLLNGVVAVVGGPERESVVALSGNYLAANGFTTDLDGCFALVQGRPELPAGRIDFKVARLTCNFPDGASKTWDVAGWLVDPDGIRGVRARIVQNAGHKALVAATGGALSGFGRRLSQEQYQYNSGTLGSSASFIGNATHDALGGSAEGAANALSQSIADYYNMYAPSLQVGGGTQVSLVIANELKFPSSGRSATQTHSVP
jgi:TolA-binding protein